jgi:hypothetical protein
MVFSNRFNNSLGELDGLYKYIADIEQMFHSFHVEPEHRDLLRFLWYGGNNPDGEIFEYIEWMFICLATSVRQP